jgi:hypothetical protein
MNIKKVLILKYKNSAFIVENIAFSTFIHFGIFCLQILLSNKFEIKKDRMHSTNLFCI